MENCHPVPTPAVDSGKEATMSEEDLPVSQEQKDEIKDLPFLELIGCLWWLAQMTRLDIFVALQRASHWVSKPSIKLWRWLVRILKYLAGTTDLGLVYVRESKQQEPLRAYFDASFADNPTMRSTAGWVFLVHGAVVAYDSHTIKRVVTSSTEAECAALTIVGKENTWERRIYGEMMGLAKLQPTAIYGDNTASLALFESGVTKRSRHFDIEWFKNQDLVEMGEMKVSWVATEVNLADFFTKKLARERFQMLRDQLMGSKERQNYFANPASPIVCSMITECGEDSEVSESDDVGPVYRGPPLPFFTSSKQYKEYEAALKACKKSDKQNGQSMSTDESVAIEEKALSETERELLVADEWCEMAEAKKIQAEDLNAQADELLWKAIAVYQKYVAGSRAVKPPKSEASGTL
jgi:hypothetical protein